jgi:glycerol kinase
MPSHQERLVLSVDQGTSSTFAGLYDEAGQLVASSRIPVRTVYPAPGWVEQDPYEILNSILGATTELVERAGVHLEQIAAMGFAHQGESLLLWDQETGRPIHNVISWRCVRSAPLCEQLERDGFAQDFRQRTGLALDAEWPATKIPWVLEHVTEAQRLRRAGRLAYSQIDAWLIHQLTGNGLFVTDHSMAARSGLFNVWELDWDGHLLSCFDAEGIALPRVQPSAACFGEVELQNGWRIPCCGSLLDQSASLVGQGCIEPGDTKITYGTCAGLWVNLGTVARETPTADLSVAWSVDDELIYALTAETNAAAGALGWLHDKLGIRWADSELAAVAESAGDSGDLVLVPASRGIGASHQGARSEAAIVGLSANTGLEQLVRASLESTAFCVRDLLEALAADDGYPIGGPIRVDGGMSDNEFLMQFQADILNRDLLVAANKESTSAGAALLAGVASGVYPDVGFFPRLARPPRRFSPRMPDNERQRRCARWRQAVQYTAALSATE